jgi:hypothetical protein
MQVRNKWTGQFYNLVEVKDGSVTLECLTNTHSRKKGEQFTIDKKEYFFSYSEKRD